MRTYTNMPTVGFSLLILIFIVLGGCSSKSLSKVDGFLIEACQLTTTTAGVWKASDESSPVYKSNGKYVYSNKIATLTEQRDILKARVEPAFAAAQIDDSYRDYADSVRQMANSMDAILAYKTDPKPFIYDLIGYGLDEFAYRHATWKIECQGVALRLNN